MGFIDTVRAEGHAARSMCRVLRQQGCEIAARTCRAWKRGAVAVRTVTNAHLPDAVREAAWATVEVTGRAGAQIHPEGSIGSVEDDRSDPPNHEPQRIPRSDRQGHACARVVAHPLRQDPPHHDSRQKQHPRQRPP